MARVLSNRLLFDQFAPAFAILATRSSTDQSLLAAILNAASSSLLRGGHPDPNGFRIERCLLIRPHGMLVAARTADRGLIIRIPLEDTLTLPRYRRNHQTLQALHNAEYQTWDLIPRALLDDSVAGQSFFIEEERPGLLGITQALVRAGLLSRCVREAVAFITAFHQRHHILGKLTGEWLEEAVHRPCKLLDGFTCARLTASHIQTIRTYLMNTLAGQYLPRVRSHGDFTLENLLFGPDGTLTGVIDWDYSTEWGLPGLDLFYFFTIKYSCSKETTHPDAYVAALGDTLPDPQDEALYQGYLAALGVPRDLRLPLTVLCWVHHVAFRMTALERYPFPRLIDELIGEFPDRVCTILNHLPLGRATISAIGTADS